MTSPASKLRRLSPPRDPYPDRTPQEIDTEDKDAWCRKGEELERDFVARIVPLTGRDVRINPEKATNPYAIDLHDYDNDRPADLKSFMTPFFTCARYTQDTLYAKHSELM